MWGHVLGLGVRALHYVVSCVSLSHSFNLTMYLNKVSNPKLIESDNWAAPALRVVQGMTLAPALAADLAGSRRQGLPPRRPSTTSLHPQLQLQLSSAHAAQAGGSLRGAGPGGAPPASDGDSHIGSGSQQRRLTPTCVSRGPPCLAFLQNLKPRMRNQTGLCLLAPAANPQ